MCKRQKSRDDDESTLDLTHGQEEPFRSPKQTVPVAQKNEPWLKKKLQNMIQKSNLF